LGRVSHFDEEVLLVFPSTHLRLKGDVSIEGLFVVIIEFLALDSLIVHRHLKQREHHLHTLQKRKPQQKEKEKKRKEKNTMSSTSSAFGLEFEGPAFCLRLSSSKRDFFTCSRFSS